MAYRKTYLEDVLVDGSPIQKKCPKGRAGKDCRKEKLKDAGRKAVVALGGATLIHLGMGGYKKGDGDWVKKEGPLKKCPPAGTKEGDECIALEKKKLKADSTMNPNFAIGLGASRSSYSNVDFTDDTYKKNASRKKLIKKVCPLGTKGAECRAKKKSKSNAWSFKSKKGRHLRGNI